MNSSEIVERALRLIVPAPVGNEAIAARTALRLALEPALERVAIRVAADKSLRHLLRKSLGTVSIASGSGSLATLQSGTQPILLDETAIRSADIRDADGNKLQMLPDRGSLDNDRPTAFSYGAVEGLTLFTQYVDDGTLTVIANYIETNVANLPAQLVPMLLEEMTVGWRPVQQAA